MPIDSYPKIWNLGHAALADLFLDEVVVEEKVDGSQFSMRRDSGTGELECRSKGAQLLLDYPDKMFAAGVAVAKELELRPGWIYRCEYLKSPKHNTLSYYRIPRNHLAVYDICTGLELYLTPEEKAGEAERIGLEVVPHMLTGKIATPEELKALLDRESFLGGCKIEGVVIKNYKRFGRDGKVLLGKHVSEEFKEVNKHSWKKSNPTNRDVLALLEANYRTSPRWAKAVHRLRDEGKLVNEPKDIGILCKAIHTDIEEECEEEIKAFLYKWALPHVKRAAIRGFPEWYKERLMESQFTGVDTGVDGGTTTVKGTIDAEGNLTVIDVTHEEAK